MLLKRELPANALKTPSRAGGLRSHEVLALSPVSGCQARSGDGSESLALGEQNTTASVRNLLCARGRCKYQECLTGASRRALLARSRSTDDAGMPPHVSNGEWIQSSLIVTKRYLVSIGSVGLVRSSQNRADLPRIPRETASESCRKRQGAIGRSTASRPQARRSCTGRWLVRASPLSRRVMLRPPSGVR